MRAALVTLSLLTVAFAAEAAPKKSADKKPTAPAAAAVAKPPPDPSLPIIVHTPIESAVRDRDLSVTAEIMDPEGVFGAMVYVRTAGEEKYAPYPLDSKDDKTFTAKIPALRISKDVEYYLEAFDSVGNGPATVGSATQPMRITTIEAPPELPPEPLAGTIIEAPASTLNVPALAVAGGGAVLVAVGAVLYLGASGTVKELDAKYQTGSPRLPDDAASTRAAISKSRIGSVLMIVGGVAAVGGATWFFLPTGGSGGDVGLAVVGRY